MDELLVPRYYSVIKHPMDLGTISDNLKEGVYGERLATLLVDIRQIFKNCYQFNLKDSQIYQNAEKLEHYFERELLPEAVPEMAAVLPVPITSSEPKVVVTATPTTQEKIIVKKETVKWESAPDICYSRLEFPEANVNDLSQGKLGDSDSQSCRKILNKISNNPNSFWFHAPVSC